ncbi:dihydropteroate synthase [Chloroflexota bacterium]
MLVIGENINASNKSVAEAIASKDVASLQNMARTQAEAGADFIDVNSGSGAGEQGIMTMEWLMDLVQEATDKPLVIDSDSPEVIKAALGKYRGEKLMINSVTAEPDRLSSIGALAAERKASLVALAMGEGGIPNNVDDRLAACDIIIKHLTGLGMKEEQIYFDPLVLPIAVDANQGLVTLKTIEKIKLHYPGARTVMGLSNISFGLPKRNMVNRGFMLMSIYAGLDAAILNPMDAKMMGIIKVADMLVGKDPSCRGYIRAHRKGLLAD